jgi:hypothetical protein
MRAIFGIFAVIILGCIVASIADAQDCPHAAPYRAYPTHQWAPNPYWSPTPYWQPGYYAPQPIEMRPAIQFRTRNGFQFYIPLKPQSNHKHR